MSDVQDWIIISFYKLLPTHVANKGVTLDQL